MKINVDSNKNKIRYPIAIDDFDRKKMINVAYEDVEEKNICIFNNLNKKLSSYQTKHSLLESLKYLIMFKLLNL